MGDKGTITPSVCIQQDINTSIKNTELLEEKSKDLTNKYDYLSEKISSHNEQQDYSTENTSSQEGKVKDSKNTTHYITEKTENKHEFAAEKVESIQDKKNDSKESPKTNLKSPEVNVNKSEGTKQEPEAKNKRFSWPKLGMKNPYLDMLERKESQSGP